MYYYKRTDANGEVLECGEALFLSKTVIEITVQEYQEILAEMKVLQEQMDAAEDAAEQAKDEQIAALEQENAALLYQLLTGEEYTDV